MKFSAKKYANHWSHPSYWSIKRNDILYILTYDPLKTLKSWLTKNK